MREQIPLHDVDPQLLQPLALAHRLHPLSHQNHVQRAADLRKRRHHLAPRVACIDPPHQRPVQLQHLRPALHQHRQPRIPRAKVVHPVTNPAIWFRATSDPQIGSDSR